MYVYLDARLERDCQTRLARERRWGAKRATIVGRRLFELASLPQLSDAQSLPGVRLDTGARGLRFEFRCKYGVRMVLAPTDARGSLLKLRVDPVRVSAVRIEHLEFDAEEGP